MNQTLLAVGALGLLALLTLNVHRGEVHADRTEVTTETIAQANRVAMDVLNGYRALPFDALPMVALPPQGTLTTEVYQAQTIPVCHREDTETFTIKKYLDHIDHTSLGACGGLNLFAHAPLAANPAARFNGLATRAKGALNAPAKTLARMDGDLRYVLRTGLHGALTYEVATVVGYVGADGKTPSATPTPLKMVTVRVQPVVPDAQPLYVSQLFACDGSCD